MATTQFAPSNPNDLVQTLKVTDKETTLDEQGSRPATTDQPRTGLTWVECYKSHQPGCEYLVATKSRLGLEQMFLPDLRRVDIVQEFEATSGDTLAFKFITLLQVVETTTEKAAGITAILTNLDTQASEELFSRYIGRTEDRARLGSREKESIKKQLSSYGRYELRFVFELKEDSNGVLSQFLVDDIQVVDCSRRKPQSLPSIACVGKRVRGAQVH